MELRKFTKRGLKDFKKFYLEVYDSIEPKIKRTGSFDSKRFLKDSFSTTVDSNVVLPDGPFENRYEFGTALCSALGKNIEKLNDIEMWSWLSVYYFDEICNDPDGGYILGAWQTVVLDLNSRRKYRHKVFAPAYFVYAYGDVASAILCKPLHLHGDIFENVSGRSQKLLSVAYLTIMRKLCFDEEKNDWKPKVATHRYIKSFNKYGMLLGQLAVNNFILDCETPEAIQALIEKFPENQRPD